MAKQITQITIFVASPSDVAAERTVLDEVVTELNATLGDHFDLQLRLLKWENDVRPGFGEDAQDVINNQIGDDYDIFIGIMCSKFGTPTKRAGSGTEEEFQRAYSRWEANKDLEIMFYFKSELPPFEQVDPDQLAIVGAFRKHISDSGGAYSAFTTTDDFVRKVKLHISSAVGEWRKKNACNQPANELRVTPQSTILIEDLPYNPLANLEAVETEDDEAGIVDLVDDITTSLHEAGVIMNRMTESTGVLGNNFNKRAFEVTKLHESGASRTRGFRRIINQSADDIDIFIRHMRVDIPEFYRCHNSAIDGTSRMLMLASTVYHANPKAASDMSRVLTSYRDSISGALDSAKAFQASFIDFPSITTKFNRAKRNAIAVLEDVVVQLTMVISQLDEAMLLLGDVDF
ncbi:MAG: DUF4062 domain-containing protein [Planctomycetaceae bacterium]